MLLRFVIPAAPFSQRKPDMVLEDVESDNECQQKPEARPKVAAPPTPPSTKQAVGEQKASSSEPRGGPAGSELSASEIATKSSQEDAETQTGRWTPFIQSIRKEAEDGALATMEER